MANSKYQYVKMFEQSPILLPNTYGVVRVDGRGFHKLCAKYGFKKPNDGQALDLMNATAAAVMAEIPDLFLAYGVSDEFSFVLDRESKLFDRRESKILTTIVSTFTSHYVTLWSSYFPEKPLSLSLLPSFDGRVVLYPTVENLRDYLSWRQVDCHINNLYNTTFWALQQKGAMSATEAEKALKGTQSQQKNEILYSRFQINYNAEPPIFKKGSLLYRDIKQTKQPKTLKHLSQLIRAEVCQYEPEQPGSRRHADSRFEADIFDMRMPAGVDHRSSSSSRLHSSDNWVEETALEDHRQRVKYTIGGVVVEHTDIIRDAFWEGKPWILDL